MASQFEFMSCVELGSQLVVRQWEWDHGINQPYPASLLLDELKRRDEELARLREEVKQLRSLVKTGEAPEGYYRCSVCLQIWPIGGAHYCSGKPHDLPGVIYTFER